MPVTDRDLIEVAKKNRAQFIVKSAFVIAFFASRLDLHQDKDGIATIDYPKLFIPGEDDLPQVKLLTVLPPYVIIEVADGNY